MNVKIRPEWRDFLASQWELPYLASLARSVRAAYASGECYPPPSQVFAALDACAPCDVKAVIIGQDPYHGPGQANGLAFSVAPGVPLPPSLRNILREVSDDTGAPLPADGDLSRWARQGVLLLNTSLTVEKGKAASHSSLGWECFTGAVIDALATRREHLVFMLWGAHAARAAARVDERRHLVLRAPHPSPLSAYRGFLGCRHFSRANEYLTQHGINPIIW